jgi:hypothetical protein
MRAGDLSGGSIKALLILGLLVANLTAVRLRHPERGAAESKDSVRLTVKVPPRDPSASLGATMARAAKK